MGARRCRDGLLPHAPRDPLQRVAAQVLFGLDDVDEPLIGDGEKQ